MQALTVLLIVAYLAVWITPFWRIFRRLGYSPALALVVWFPGVNLIVLYYVAFTRRPVPIPISRR